VLGNAPDDPQALYYLGRLSSEGAASRQFFERLLAKHPHHALADDALFELAEADFADPSGRYLSAQKRLRRLLDQFPQTPHAAMAHYRIGLTFLVLNEPEPALTEFDAAKLLGPSDAAKMARLGTLEALVLKGQKADALRAAEDWLAEGTDDLEADVKAFVSRLSGKPNPGPMVQPQKVAGDFWVRVGAFGRDNAQTLKASLEAEGFRVSVVQRSNSRSRFVFVGPYASKIEANRVKKRVDAMKNVTSIVTEKR